MGGHCVPPIINNLVNIAQYAQTFPEPAADPVGVLKFLMEEHHLNQADLAEIGSQGVVSEILNGKRELIVSPAVFIAG